jgi:1-acyl-sn-glycerol-3-phosphate acyltransferase
VRGGRERGGATMRTILDALRATAAVAEGTDAGRADDEFGLDVAFRDRVKPIFQLLHDHYWRVEVSGTKHVPTEGPVILVANHSGGIPFDGAMISTTLDANRGLVVRYLYDRFVEGVSAVDAFYRRTGGAVANWLNAERLLVERRSHLLIFPEGVPGVAKTFSERYRLRDFNPGFARLAMRFDIPVVPIAVVGAEEIYPIVGRSEEVGKSFGLPYLPITPFFPLFGVLGAVPLPTKWLIRVGKPIRLPQTTDDRAVARESLLVRRKLQAMVTRLKQRRQSIFLG